MIPPNKGPSVFQDSSLNRTPSENRYILGYKGPNQIYQDVIDREQNLLSIVNVFDTDDETRTCGSPYKFAKMNSPEISHLGKTLISPYW